MERKYRALGWASKAGATSKNEAQRIWESLQKLKGQTMSQADELKGPLTDTEICQSALFHGFSLSTAYGQEPGKLIPISDSATLIKFAREIIRMSTRPQPDTAAVKAAVEALEKKAFALPDKNFMMIGSFYIDDYTRIMEALRAIAKGDGG